MSGNDPLLSGAAPSSKIQEFEARLISSSIALRHQIRGCDPRELEEIEKLYGILPTSYRQIMLLIGRRAGKLVDRGEFEFYIDQLPTLNSFIHECRQGPTDEADKLPPNTFFICSRYGDSNNFLLTNTGKDDSPVYLYRDDGSIKEIRPSVWDWIRDFEEDSKYWIRTGVR